MSLELKDLYWLAGLLEGEGCFYCPKPGVKGKSIAIILSMTDRDVVERAAKLLNTSVIVKKSKDGCKEVYTARMAGSRPAGWMMTLYSLMGERRKVKIKECLAFWKTKSRSGNFKSYCKNGHKFDKKNTYIYVRDGIKCRACRACAKENGKKWDLAHPTLRALHRKQSAERIRNRKIVNALGNTIYVDQPNSLNSIIESVNCSKASDNA